MALDKSLSILGLSSLSYKGLSGYFGSDPGNQSQQELTTVLDQVVIIRLHSTSGFA